MRKIVKKLIKRGLNKAVPLNRDLSNPYISAKLIPFDTIRNEFKVYEASDNDQIGFDGLPVPPIHLWEGYDKSVEGYLHGGIKDVEVMTGILSNYNISLEKLERVIDLGCASGRMLRFIPYVEEKSERWGLDINANHITWCQQNFNPPFYFATNTTYPHLPFEDNYFDLLYCGSVFTHISDLADSWFLEVRRVLRKGGFAYITIHNKKSIELLLGKYATDDLCHGFVEQLRGYLNKNKVKLENFKMFFFFSDPYSQVFYDNNYIISKWSNFMEFLVLTEEAHDYQAALLFQKR